MGLTAISPDILNRIEAVFVQGQLAEKRAEIIRLRETGETRLFDGGVAWRIELPDEDKRLSGASESLDNAFGDMAACLTFLAEDHNSDTKVFCSIEQSSAEPAE